MLPAKKKYLPICKSFGISWSNKSICRPCKQLQTHFGDKVYQTVIPRNVRLAEAPSYGEPAISYDPDSKGSKAYLALADEMLELAKAKTAATA